MTRIGDHISWSPHILAKRKYELLHQRNVHNDVGLYEIQLYLKQHRMCDKLDAISNANRLESLVFLLRYPNIYTYYES